MNVRHIQTIWMKEIRTYFSSPIAYVIAAVFVGLTGFSFALSVESRFPEATVRGFLFGPTGAFFLVILMTPALTMRLFAEEAKLGTMELLLTAPIRDSEIVLGKFLAAFTMMLAMFSLTLYFPLLLIWFGDPEILPILTAYAGLVLMGSVAVAIGLLGSSLTSNQIVAAVVSLAVLLLLWLASFVATLGDPGSLWVDFIRFLSLNDHLRDLTFGILDSRDIVYFLSLTAFFLFITSRIVEMRRWR
ncbi:MAG: ABC transporter permease [Dehalococcoidia bacterium]|jgi:ABC-2 type transport system permease protein|nr:ABC transporter permease [Dehalococcoidia bacterium]